MLFRRSSRRRESDHLRSCPACDGRLVCPTDWVPSDDSHWRIELRCADCGHEWETVVGDGRALRFDLELDCDVAAMRRTIRRLDLERMELEVETFAVALSRDLIEPADFVV